MKIQNIIHSQTQLPQLPQQQLTVTRNPIVSLEEPVDNDVRADAQAQIEQSSAATPLTDILRKLQQTNLLPQILNADNLDESIQSLVTILNNLKESQHAAERPPQQHHDVEYADTDYDDEEQGKRTSSLYTI